MPFLLLLLLLLLITFLRSFPEPGPFLLTAPHNRIFIRSKCRTKCPAYIEVTTLDIARELIKQKNMKEFRGRRVRISIAPRKELLAAASGMLPSGHLTS